MFPRGNGTLGEAVLHRGSYKKCWLYIFRAPFYKNTYGGLLLHWLEIGWKSLGLLLLKQQFICLVTQDCCNGLCGRKYYNFTTLSHIIMI